MPPMKKNTFFCTFMLVLAMTASAWALSAGTSASQGAAFNTESQKTRESIFSGAPTRLAFGGYTLHQKRGVDVGGTVEKWKIEHWVAYATLDITSWLTILGGGGQSDLTRGGESSDGDTEWVAGGTLRLLDYFAMDPIIGEDPYWFSINVDGQYTGAKAGDVDWSEFYGDVLLNITSRTERWGFMDSITLYFGPAFSVIEGTNPFNNDLSQDQTVGFVAGLAFNPSDNLTLKTELQNFDDTSWGIGATFHF